MTEIVRHHQNLSREGLVSCCSNLTKRRNIIEHNQTIGTEFLQHHVLVGTLESDVVGMRSWYFPTEPIRKSERKH